MEATQTLAGRYGLIEHLARGGMADVFAARDELLGRRVAVKMLHSQFSADQAFVKRFRREAQAAANLSHPNIVSIYDWGEADQTYFIVMELVDGRSLREVLRTDGALLPRRGVEIAAEVATALAVAHRAGLVHRDIKPGNILLTNGGNVKVADFGIARAWDDSSELTKTGAVIGTATYFSPEQAQGTAADERSDLYSLGVVLYEMLTGRPPFQGDTPVAIAYQHVSSEPPLPSIVNPDVSGELDRLVMRALHKDPASRYQTAEELRGDLLMILQGPEAIIASEAPTRIVDRQRPMTPSTRVAAAPYDQPPSQLPFILTTMALLLTLVLGIFLLFRLLTPGGTVQASELVEVPEVTNLAESEALTTLQTAGFRVNPLRQPSDLIEKGRVIRTEPAAFAEAETGSTVAVYISDGAEVFGVPPLVGQTQEQAEQLITASRFQVGDITTRSDPTAATGTVAEQDPAANVLVPAGTRINLVISTGPEQIILGDYAEMQKLEAVFAIGRLGLAYEVEYEISEEIPQDFVIRTDPLPGTPMEPGALVKVIVSEGPPTLAVPALFGLTPEAAQTRVEEAGLVFRIAAETKLTNDPNLAGRVFDQFPAAGASVTAGTTVQVYLGELAPQPGSDDGPPGKP